MMKDVCIRGHSLDDPTNIYLRHDGFRGCRACWKIRYDAREHGPFRHKSQGGLSHSREYQRAYEAERRRMWRLYEALSAPALEDFMPPALDFIQQEA